ncbi:MAG: ABC transporter ATP-binding protein/permease [Planctomycetes bacterium]|nr:ABC transporter ATP-binding protein/permease [Planctomycetota bacterium]
MKLTLRILSYCVKYRYWYLMGLFALLIVDMLELALPATAMTSIQSLDTESGEETAGPMKMILLWLFDFDGSGSAERLEFYFMLVIVFGCAVALQSVMRYFWRLGFILSSIKIARDLRRQFFEKLQSLGSDFYAKSQTGELLSLATNDTEAVRFFLGIGVLLFFDTFFYLLFACAFLFFYNVELALWAVIPLPMLPFLASRLSNVVHKRFKVVQQKLADLSAFAQESFSGTQVIKSFGREEAETERFSKHSEDYRNEQIHLWRAQSFVHPTLHFIVLLMEGIILAKGALMVMDGEIAVATLAAFLLTLSMLTWPMMALGWVISIWQRGRASFERVLEVMETPSSIVDSEHADPALKVEKAKIVFRKVSFQYDTAEERQHAALSEVSFSIEVGESVAFVGPIGSGKTTIARLIARFYDPDSGEIEINDRGIRDYRLKNLRGSIGFVQQEGFLFSSTIKDNIAFGKPELDIERVREYARIARVEDDILAFPEGYETRLGERGVNLSGGQKQRVSIARALAIDPPILIFDDCLSAVDAKTEEEITRELKGARAGKTSITITHRLTSLRDRDCIYVMKAGRIVDQGTHSELMMKDSWYRETFEKQLIEQALTE